MFKRPSRGETEDDILRLEKEFLANSNKPSAKCITKPIQNSEKDIIKLDDTGVTERSSSKSKTKQTRFKIDCFDNKTEDAPSEKDSIEVFSNIKERDLLNFSRKFHMSTFDKGFPSAPKLHTSSNNNSKGKKQSLFAQQFLSLDKKGKFGRNTDDAPMIIEQKDIISEKVSSHYEDQVTDQQETPKQLQDINREEIHQENVEKLQQMTEEEILEEQTNLLRSLDPKIVSFLKKNKKTEKGKELYKQEIPQEKLTPVEKNIKKEVSDNTFDPHKKFNIDKTLPHMGVVEEEKLEWMKDLPKITTKDSTLPRFDHSGKVMDKDGVVLIDKGLYHHAEDPALPGYTLEELFGMIRSSFPKQRVFGLEVIAKIVESYHSQEYVGLFTNDLLEQCLNAGLIFILRWSLDEQIEQINSAAIQVLANIIYVPDEQNYLKKYFFAYKGHILPTLCNIYKKSKSEMTQEELEEDRDYTDAEILREDVIKGLLQIQILERIAYLIGVYQSSENAIVNLLKILIRLSQHDQESCYTVYKCKNLMPSVLALLEKDNINMKVYLYDLLSSLCRGGPSIAKNIIGKYPLEESMVSLFTSSFMLTNQPSILGSVVQLWVILLNYGITCSSIKNIYPFLLEKIQAIASDFNSINDYTCGCILRFVEAIILSSKRVLDDEHWSIVISLSNLLKISMKTALQTLYKENKVTHPLTITLLIRCCAAIFKAKNYQINRIVPADILDEASSFWSDYIESFISSQFWEKLIGDLLIFSNFILQESPTTKSNELSCLPGYGLNSVHDQQALNFSNGSPMMLLQAIIKLIVQLMKINKNLIVKGLPITISPGVLAYLQTFLTSKFVTHASKPLHAIIDRSLLCDILYIFYMTIEQNDLNKFTSSIKIMYLQATFKLLPNLTLENEKRALTLMQGICFGRELYQELNYVVWSSGGETEWNKLYERLLCQCAKVLPKIAKSYETFLFGKHRKGDSTEHVIKPNLSSAMKVPVLPSDWMFYPLIQTHSSSIKVESQGNLIGKVNEHTIGMITKCLQLIFLLEVKLPDAFNEISETTRLTRLFCLFLIEGRIYGESVLEDIVYGLVSIYSSPKFVTYFNFKERIPGITSFYDLYSSLIEHYLTSSFNDYTFANILLIPMQLRHDVMYRKAVWTDYKEILRVFPLPISKVLGNIGDYLAIECEDIKMIQIYFNAAKNKSIKKTWCPFFYLIAVHHINQFIFASKANENKDEKQHSIRTNMISSLLKFTDKDLRDDIIYYEKPDPTNVNGFKRFIHLPPSREIILRREEVTK